MIRLPDNARTLRILLAGIFLALAVPTALLVYQAYSQLKWEAFHLDRLRADEFMVALEQKTREVFAREDARSVSDYEFLVVTGDTERNFVQRSPLSVLPGSIRLPGLIAHFQIDQAGRLSTPLLPGTGKDLSAYGITPAEGEQRKAIINRVAQQLTAPERPHQNDPVAAGAALAKDDRQMLFDTLRGQAADASADTKPAGGRVDELDLDERFIARSKPDLSAPASAPSADPQRRRRKEQVAVITELAEEAAAEPSPIGQLNVSIFESEVEPFDFATLDDNTFVLFRWVTKSGERLVQGALVERTGFLRGLIGDRFLGTSLSRTTDLLVAYGGSVIATFGADDGKRYAPATELDGTLLHRARLPAPLDDLELVFNIRELPAGPGLSVVIWTTVVLALVFLAGFFALYRLGLRQIQLGRQQQDFVAAVSHELKTPLTSIRMYGEMLQAGWVDDEKRRTYYDFICAESERLSRLIANVLEMARLSNNETQLQLKTTPVATLVDLIISKVGSQVGHAGFELTVADRTPSGTSVEIDADAFAQIVINLVDNGIKFARDAEPKRIEITLNRGNGSVVLAVRDFGPGIPQKSMKKVFELFYRPENELTRETVGTGIGLALVNQLARAMGGSVDVWNPDPGAEFRVTLPTANQS